MCAGIQQSFKGYFWGCWFSEEPKSEDKAARSCSSVNWYTQLFTEMYRGVHIFVLFQIISYEITLRCVTEMLYSPRLFFWYRISKNRGMRSRDCALSSPNTTFLLIQSQVSEHNHAATHWVIYSVCRNLQVIFGCNIFALFCRWRKKHSECNSSGPTPKRRHRPFWPTVKISSSHLLHFCGFTASEDFDGQHERQRHLLDSIAVACDYTKS